MQKSGFFIAVIMFCGAIAFAQDSRDFIQHFATRRIEFPNENSPYAQVSPGRYPRLLHFLYEYVLDWNPSGRRAEYSPGCEPDFWAERMLDPRLRNIKLQGALIQKYFRDCDRELKTGENSSFWNPLKMMTMKFDFKNHPFLHRVVFNLPGDIKLKGLLALKGDRKPRPWVVVRLGIFGGVEEFLAERYLMLQLFEQSPFNVLVLDNLSSPDFIAHNSRVSFGGYDEGLQNILIAKLLRDPSEPLSQLVHSLHFTGVSLGGHGVLYASLLNQWNENPIQSFLGICPVVNLKASMENLNGGVIFQKITNYWSSVRMQGLREKIPSLEEVSSFEFMPKVRESIQRNYTGGLSYYSGIHLPPGTQDSRDFWKLNDFWGSYNEVTSPVLILATEKDSIVPFAMNSKNLRKSNIKVVSFDEGVHCTFAVPYKWDAFTTLLQAYVLAHSPGFQMKQESLQIDVTHEKIESTEGPLKFEVKWPSKKERFVRIELEDFQVSLPVDSFDFRFTQNQLFPAEKAMLERWLYQNLKVHLNYKKQQKSLLLSWAKAL